MSDKTIKLWKVSERDRRAEGYNLKETNHSHFHRNKIENEQIQVTRYRVTGTPWISRDKTMADKLIYIPNDN